MARSLNDPNRELRQIWRAIRQLQKATPLANASVGGGRLRFYDGGELLIEGGNLRVTGTAYVDGVLTVSGTLDGVGNFTWSGPWTLAGDGDITGNVDITGMLTLLSELVVKAAGKITIEGADGPTVLQNSKLRLSNGSELKASGSGVALTGGTSAVSVAPGIARLMNTGSGQGFESDGFYAGARVVGMPTIASSAAGGLPAGAVYTNGPAGVLYRVVPG